MTATSSDAESLREQLIAALGKIGYPPVKLVGEGGASGHFRHDNEAFAGALIAAIPALDPIAYFKEQLPDALDAMAEDQAKYDALPLPKPAPAEEE